MKHLFYSDVHMKPENLAHVETVFAAIEAGAQQHGVVASGGYVVNGGDLFNERGVIRTSVFDLLAATRRRWAEKQMKHIDNIGNHDQEDRGGTMHPLRVFDMLPGSQVIEGPTFIEGLRWWFFPYSHRLEEQLREALYNARPFQTCFVHAGIKDAWRNDKSRDTDGISVDAFKDFRRVFSGHYHYRHAFENVQYIGSPMQHSFSELGQNKGYLIYDDETGKSEFHVIDGTPRHFDLQLTWTELGREERSQSALGWDEETNAYDADTPRMLPGPGDIVRFKVKGPAERVRGVTRDYLAKLTPATTIKIERETTDQTYSRLALEEGGHGDVTSLMEKYINHLEPALDRARLLTLGVDLMGL